MKIRDLVPNIIKESFTDISVVKLGIDNLVNRADESLQDPAASAINYFVGMTPNAKNQGVEFGIMQQHRLEDAYSSSPSEIGRKIRQQLEQAFSPVKAALKQKFGNTITLYRGQNDVGSETRNTLSWTSDPRVAASFVGVDARLMKIQPITDEQIAAAVKTYNQTGEVEWRGKKFIRSDEPTRSPDQQQFYNDIAHDEFYYEIYDRNGDHVTDGDDIENEFKTDQEFIQSAIDKRNQKLAKLLTAKISVDDIIWITDRAGQSEFILHNHPGKSGYVDAVGKLIKG